MITQQLDPSTNPAEACARLLDDVGHWVHDCMARYADAPATDVHDQGTFTTGWEPYIRLREDGEALSFLQSVRDKISAHFTGTDQWHHGYWRMQEAHHGTEHFELFLGMLLRLDPDDARTKAQLVDAAEHLGNWVAEVPPWFDWQSGLFRSSFFGTDAVRTEPGMALNMPDHFRCVNISLLAHEATGESRYLELARTHALRWADAILHGERLPIGLDASGALRAFTPETERIYRSFVGQAGTLRTDVDRAENFLCSDATGALLSLWQRTGEVRFRRAAERLLDLLATQLDDPDAGAAAAAVRVYRRATGSDRYDRAVLRAIPNRANDSGPPAPPNIQTLSLEPTPRHAHRPAGVGKRGDMPSWFEDGQPRCHNPITLAVAAEIANDSALATAALDLARGYFALARRAFPDGRDHGCAAQSVSAVARGHGRENHAGVLTAVLGPLAASFL